jgi:cob(I)alamin adenosyltransferase
MPTRSQTEAENKSMKIYTKTGDTGETGLFGGKRVSKDDLRVDAYGTVDELNAFIGLLNDAASANTPVNNLLLDIQCRLFGLGAHLATDPDSEFKVDPDILLEDIIALENAMDNMDQSLAPLRNFILPGGHTTVSICHICRTVCRRAERLVVHLSREAVVDAMALSYLNRLSDYFFVLARHLAVQYGVQEVVWKKR